jgi:hypothetical protein
VAFTAHRARDRGASGDSGRLSEGGGDRSAAAAWVGSATTGKTGQRGGSEASKSANSVKDNCETPSHKEQAKTETSKPANGVTTGFGMDLRGPGAGNLKPVVCASACEPFREAIELGLRQGRNAMAIWQDLVSENGFGGGYQTGRAGSLDRRRLRLKTTEAPHLPASFMRSPVRNLTQLCTKTASPEIAQEWGKERNRLAGTFRLIRSECQPITCLSLGYRTLSGKD